MAGKRIDATKTIIGAIAKPSIKSAPISVRLLDSRGCDTHHQSSAYPAAKTVMPVCATLAQLSPPKEPLLALFVYESHNGPDEQADK